MVDEAREINLSEAKSFTPTGKKPAKPRPKTPLAAMPGPGAKASGLPTAQKVYIRLSSTKDEKTLVSLKETIDANQGETEVVIVLGNPSGRQAIKLPGGINSQSSGIKQLKALVGPSNLVIQ